MKLDSMSTNICYTRPNCQQTYIIEQYTDHPASLRYDDLLGNFQVACYGCRTQNIIPEDLLQQLSPGFVQRQYTALKQQFPNTTPTKPHFMFTEETNNETI